MPINRCVLLGVEELETSPEELWSGFLFCFPPQLCLVITGITKRLADLKNM